MSNQISADWKNLPSVLESVINGYNGITGQNVSLGDIYEKSLKSKNDFHRPVFQDLDGYIDPIKKDTVSRDVAEKRNGGNFSNWPQISSYEWRK